METRLALQGVHDRTNSAPSALRREPALMTIDETRELTKRAKSDTQLLPPPPPLPRTGRPPVKVILMFPKDTY